MDFRYTALAMFSIGTILFFGIVGLGRAAFEAQTFSALESTGVRDDAEITGLRDNLPFSRAFFVTYTYEAGGTPYTTEDRIRRARYEALTVGDQLPIYYLPEDPAVALPVGSTVTLMSLALTSVAWLLAGIGSAVLYRRTIRRLVEARQRRAELWDEAVAHIEQVAAELREEQTNDGL